MVRLVIAETGAFLHLSGKGTTTDVTWSWLGYLHQAETLRRRAEAQDEDWPFVAVHRDDFDADREAQG